MDFKVGDEVMVIFERWAGIVVELPGYSNSFPNDYRVKNLDDGSHGLCSPHEIRKLTKLERALK